MWRDAASVLVSVGLVLTVTGPACAEATDPVLVLFACDGAQLQEHLDCDALLDAIARELGDFDAEVQPGGVGTEDPQTEAVSVMQEMGATCIVRVVAEGQEGIALQVFWGSGLQPASELVVEEDVSGTPDYMDAAFRLRTLVIPALTPVLPDLPEPVVESPDEEETLPTSEDGPTTQVEDPPAEFAVEADVAPERRWGHVGLSYLLLGYPTEGQWYHGIGIRAGVLVLPALEVFLDAGITIPRTADFVSAHTGERLVVSNGQYLVGVGVGYTFRVVGPFSLTPLAGFHVGISHSRVHGGGPTFRYVNTSIWGGLEARVTIRDRVNVLALASVENLFNYEYIDWLESETYRVFSLAQLRLDVIAGVSVTF